MCLSSNACRGGPRRGGGGGGGHSIVKHTGELARMSEPHPKYFLNEKLFCGTVKIILIKRKKKHVSVYFYE